MRLIFFSFSIAITLIVGSAWSPSVSLHERVSDLLLALGDTSEYHIPDLNMENVSVERGRDLVLEGRSKVHGKRSRLQSKYFTCVACHNIEREDPNLADPSPEDRLAFVEEKNLPFLQGSPLYGVVNRTSYYNGDYVKKYGDLVKPTRKDLREAIQLCAVECSQGRALKPWEIESVLAYFWTIDLKVADLNLNDVEKRSLERALHTGESREQAIHLIKSKYQQEAPATFLDPPVDRTAVNEDADPTNGKKIYELSCLHCHMDNSFAFFRLDQSKFTFRYLQKHLSDYTEHSVYQVARYGTSPKGGKRGYMPQYTAEKLTDSQLADLRAYIDLEAQ
jgi:mono/diheme cytochrome c family protein